MRRASSVVFLVLVGCAATPSAAPSPSETLVRVTAKRFEFAPSEIHLKAGVPAAIELTSLDTTHGFAAPDLHVDAEIEPGKPALVHVAPQRAGTYLFHCSVFCGEGHESMGGRIIVDP